MEKCIHCGATPRSWLLSNPVTCPECRKIQIPDTTGWADLERSINELVEQVEVYGGARTSDVEGIKNVVHSMLATQKREISDAVQMALYKKEKNDPRWAPVRLRGWKDCKTTVLEVLDESSSL